MNKVGILTFHTGFNYGASLQAFALQRTITKMGLNCEIIHFETERFVASREMFSRKPRRVKEFIKIATRIPYYSALKKRQKLFEDYTAQVLKTSPLYRTEAEVIAHAGDYDCIVCGSDQIWNLDKEQDAPAANPLFFLNFPKNQRRVSYAASFGKWVKKAHAHEDAFMPWLKEFDAVSVRETSGVEYLRSRGIACTLTLDPTVLLDKEDYEEICAPRQIEGKYVLMFSWSCGDEVMAAAKRAAQELQLPLYHLIPPPRAMGTGIRRKLDVGPREFLSMIKNAEFVVTDSFHGTAFSTTFEKPFVSIVTGGKADPRMESLMEQLGLSDHLTDCAGMNIPALQETDFISVREKKTALRRSSLEFLRNALLVEE